MATYKKTKMEALKEHLVNLYMAYWKNIATNIFEWEGLPESELLTSEIIENWLYEKGRAGFFDDEMYGYLCLKLEKEGFNIVGKPTKYRLWGNNYIKAVSPDKCVLIKNNETETPTKVMLEYYCNCIADIEIVKMLRRNAHKTPFMLDTSVETELSAKNVFKNIDANDPVIFKNRGRGDADIGIDVLNTGVDYINDKLNDEKNSYIADILTLLGITNYLEDKAERVQSAEVEANMGYVQQSFNASLEKRQKACDKINEMFGLNVSIKYKEPTLYEDETTTQEEGDINE